MAENLYATVQPVAFLIFCSTRLNSTQRRKKICSREQLDIGRDDVKKLLGIEALTISTHHLRLRCVVYDDDDDEQGIAPMIYLRVLSFNSVELKRPGIGHNTGANISRGHGDILLGAGDVIWLTADIYLQFQYRRSVELDNALDSLQRAEAKCFANQFFLSGRRLGVGGQASVYVAVKQSNKRQFACKAVPLSITAAHTQDGCDGDLRLTTAQRKAKLAREYVILEKLDHPNIVSIEKVICGSYNVYIFQQLVTGGDLSSYIDQSGPLAEPEAATITLQLLKAVDYLHRNGYVHRDIKPENILMTSWRAGTRVVLTDFGQARAIDGPNAVQRSAKALRMQSLVGTSGYTAPEIVQQVRQSLKETGYSKAVDIWSIGCVTAVLLTCNTPFSQDETDFVTAKNASSENTYLERYDVNVIDGDQLWTEISRKAKDFVKGCLASDEGQRLTTNSALLHDWLRNKHYKAELQAAYERAIADWQPRKQQGGLIEFMETKNAVSTTSKARLPQAMGAELKSKHFMAAQKPMVLPMPAMRKTAFPPPLKSQPADQHAMSRDPREAQPAIPPPLQRTIQKFTFASPTEPFESNPFSDYSLAGSTGPFSIHNHGPPQTQYTPRPHHFLHRDDNVIRSQSMLDEPIQTQFRLFARAAGHLHEEERVIDSQETRVPSGQIAVDRSDRPRKKVCR